MKQGNFLYLLAAIATVMIGYTMHGSLFWAIVDFFLWPIVVIYWLITHKLTLGVIEQTFSFFFNK